MGVSGFPDMVNSYPCCLGTSKSEKKTPETFQSPGLVETFPQAFCICCATSLLLARLEHKLREIPKLNSKLSSPKTRAHSP